MIFRYLFFGTNKIEHIPGVDASDFDRKVGLWSAEPDCWFRPKDTIILFSEWSILLNAGMGW